jgi:hypothetical protein
MAYNQQQLIFISSGLPCGPCFVALGIPLNASSAQAKADEIKESEAKGHTLMDTSRQSKRKPQFLGSACAQRRRESF